MARAVFFNRLGELRDRSFENQRYRASGLNLVVAAIILWNTGYLERATQGLKAQGQANVVELRNSYNKFQEKPRGESPQCFLKVI